MFRGLAKASTAGERQLQPLVLGHLDHAPGFVGR